MDGLAAELRHCLGDPALEVTRVDRFGDGHSGLTYIVDLRTGGVEQRCVLRTSAPGINLVGPNDVGRQGRILTAVGRAGLPVPAVLAMSAEPVLDGRAYVLLELVEGRRWDEAVATGGHRAVAAEAVDVLRRLAGVPPAVTGIGEEAPATPDGELARWARLAERGPDVLTGAGTKLRSRLEDHVPDAGAAVLVHGDLHYGNLLFRDGRVVALLDWEIAGLGDPLVDLGSLAVASRRSRFAPEPNPTGSVDVTLADLIDLHGADPGRAVWFVALSCFKYAAIIGYNLGLHRCGKRFDPIYEQLSGTMSGLIDDGLALLDGGPEAW